MGQATGKVPTLFLCRRRYIKHAKRTLMAKLIFNTRDELTAIDIDSIAIVQANGNYSKVYFMNKREVNLSMGITQVEEALKRSKDKKHMFIRLGRSLLINHRLLQRIDILKQVLTLYDGVNELRVKVAKNSLKAYKEAIVKSIMIKNNEASIDRSGE